VGWEVSEPGVVEDAAAAWAGLDAGAGPGRDEDDAAAAELADDAVRDGVALERDALLALHRLLGVLGGLLDGRRHLVGLAVAGRHLAVVVADHDQRVEAEAPAALDHRGAAPNLHHAVFQPVLPRLAGPTISLSSHDALKSEIRIPKSERNPRTKIRMTQTAHARF